MAETVTTSLEVCVAVFSGTIDWGDSNSRCVKLRKPSAYVYASSAGTYTITISGDTITRLAI